MQKGMQEGIQEGMQKGEVTILLRQMTKKFGTLSPDYCKRIESADEKTLLEWSDNILSAIKIEDVFN